MGRTYFGTDGIRGRANSDGLTAAASLLLILVVRRLTALQEMRAAATALA